MEKKVHLFICLNVNENKFVLSNKHKKGLIELQTNLQAFANKQPQHKGDCFKCHNR